jgi:hypothetical protein
MALFLAPLLLFPPALVVLTGLALGMSILALLGVF